MFSEYTAPYPFCWWWIFGWFYVFIVNKAAVDILVHTLWWKQWFIASTGVSWPAYIYLALADANSFSKWWLNFHSCQLWKRVPFVPHPYQHFVLAGFFNFSLSWLLRQLLNFFEKHTIVCLAGLNLLIACLWVWLFHSHGSILFPGLLSNLKVCFSWKPNALLC